MRPARYKSARGGRGSSKSHTLAQINVLRMAGLLPDYEPTPVRIASCRDFETAIKESIKNAVEHYIKVLGLRSQFKIHAFEIDHVNGSHMFFPGVTRKLSSFLSMEGVDVFWMEQAEVLRDEMEIVVPTIRTPGSELQFSWNPNVRTSWCWKRFVLRPRPKDVSVLVNYQSNPWFPDELDEERRAMLEEEPDRYPHVWLGEPDDGDADRQVLTYATLEACVRAWKAGLAPARDEAPLCDVGLDIAEGGSNKCAEVVRVGPVVDFLDMWPGVAGDLSVAARRAHNNLEHYAPYRLYYDGSSPMMSEFRRLDVDYGVRAINFGGKVGGPTKLYETRRPNDQVFALRNIQMADALRLRANRTVRLLKGDRDVEPMDCLFIRDDLPDLEGYLADMTQPVRRQSPQSGKWELDKRGSDSDGESPDRFDATCLAFARDSDDGLRAR